MFSLFRRRLADVPVGSTVVDPVCGMSITVTMNTLGTEHDGAKYWFCSEDCRSKFMVDPKSFIDKK